MRKMMLMSACAAALAGPSAAFEFGSDVVGEPQEPAAAPEAAPEPAEDSGRSLKLPETLAMSPEEREAAEQEAAKEAAERARLERLTRPDGDLPDLTARTVMANVFDEDPETRLTPQSVITWYAAGSEETCDEVRAMDEFDRQEKIQEAASEVRVYDEVVFGPFPARLPEYDFAKNAYPFSEGELGGQANIGVRLDDVPRGCARDIREVIRKDFTMRIEEGLIDLPMKAEAAKSLSRELDDGRLIFEAALSFNRSEEHRYIGNKAFYDVDRIHFYSGVTDENEVEGYLMSYDLEAGAWVKGTGEVLDDGTVERGYERVYPPAAE